MARLDPASFPDRLDFERHARGLRRQELDAFFKNLERGGARALRRLLGSLHLRPIHGVRSRHI